MKTDAYQISARLYDTFVEPFNKGLRQIGFRMCPPRKGMRVLEVGCGTGTNLQYYQQAGCSVHGVDLSASMVLRAKKKMGARADIRLASAAALPFPENVFDLVIAMLTLHEMAEPTRTAVLEEMVRVVKDNGRLLLIDFHPGRIHSLKGWLAKAVILFFEITAGREHFRNSSHFIANNGLHPLIESLPLAIEKQKIVAGGNLAVVSLRRRDG